MSDEMARAALMERAVRLVMAKRDALFAVVECGKLEPRRAAELARMYSEGMADALGLLRLDLEDAVCKAELAKEAV